MRRLLLSVIRLLPVVLGTSLVVVGLLWLVRRWLPLDGLRDSSDEVGNYLQTVGTVYAVLLAFVVSAVWSQFNESRSVVEREATEIVDLIRSTDGFPNPQRAALHAALAAYVDAVISREWPAMARGDEPAMEDVGRTLDRVWADLYSFEPTTECQKTLHAEALRRFNDLSDARTTRLTTARIRMPFGLKLLLYAGAVVVIASMGLLPVDCFAVHAIITGALTGAISHILYLVADLDDAFNGLYHVSCAPFERARIQVLRKRPAPDA